MPENLPNDYGDAAAEYAAVRTRAGLVDRRDWGVVELTGRDRVPFLHALLSNDVKSLAPGQGGAATLLDVHGKGQGLLDILRLEARPLLLLAPAGGRGGGGGGGGWGGGGRGWGGGPGPGGRGARGGRPPPGARVRWARPR